MRSHRGKLKKLRKRIKSQLRARKVRVSGWGRGGEGWIISLKNLQIQDERNTRSFWRKTLSNAYTLKYTE